MLCRIVGEKLSAAWNQPVIVDNRAGAAAMSAPRSPIAPSRTATRCCAARRRPLAINHNLYKTLPYDWTKFVPIAVLAIVPNVITARIDLPASSLKELIAYAKANPGKVTYASQGNGSTSHLSAQMLATMAGIEIVHVPYKGEGPALVDLTAGRVDIFIGNISAALRFEKTRQAKFLGLASRTRSPVAPDVPTTAETRPARSHRHHLVRFRGAARHAGRHRAEGEHRHRRRAETCPTCAAAFLDLGAEPQGGTTAATASFIKEEEVRWRVVIQSANVTLE